MGIDSYYAIVFPFTYFLDSIDVCGIRIEGTNAFEKSESEFKMSIRRAIPQLTHVFLNKAAINFSLGLTLAPNQDTQFIENLYDRLLIIRYLITKDNLHGGIEYSDYLVMKFDQSPPESQDSFFEMWINGLEHQTSFLGDPEETLYEHAHPYSNIDTISATMLLHKLNSLNCMNRRLVRWAIERYISSHSPNRYSSDFQRIVNLVAGIEPFLELGTKDGAEQFGEKLSIKLETEGLKLWGKQMYLLRNDFIHAKPPVRQVPHPIDPNLWTNLAFNNSNDKEYSPFHFGIGNTVLEQLIQMQLTNTKQSSFSKPKMLSGNASVFRELKSLCQDNSPLNTLFLQQVELVDVQKIDAKIDDMKFVSRYIIMKLRAEFDELKEALPSSPDLATLDDVHKNLYGANRAIVALRNNLVLSSVNVEHWNILHTCEQYFFRMSQILGVKIANAARTSHK